MKIDRAVVRSEHDSEASPTEVTAGVEVSRAVAVDRVFKGFTTAVGGYGLSLGAGAIGIALGVPPLITIGASAVVIGLGLAWAGRGAKHLLKYGDFGSAVPLLSAAGLGGAILATVSTRALLELTTSPVLLGLNQIAMGASGLFTAILLIQVLVMLVRWMLPGSGVDADDRIRN